LCSLNTADRMMLLMTQIFQCNNHIMSKGFLHN
jgi:hypothetical protein